MNYWLFKSEAETWSWQQQVTAGEKGESWDGVRNHQANNNMKSMRCGDLGFFYHSGKERRIVGIVEVIAEHLPDDTDAAGIFGMVWVKAIQSLPKPVSLADVKANEYLKDMVLARNSRLSVQPVTKPEWDLVLKMSETGDG